jgi:hypothetical protein
MFPVRNRELVMIYHFLLYLIAASTAVYAFPIFSRSKKVYSTSLFSVEENVVTYFDDLELACKAATEFWLCKPNKLAELADKVDAGADSCVFAIEGDELCEKEIQDRKDVAEVLRLQMELQLRMEAVQGSSLFASDVLEEAMIQQRDALLEVLEEDGI